MTPPRSRRAAALAIATVVLASLAACGIGREPQVVELTVPAGTQARLQRGETVAIMPAELHLRVGDTIRIRNDDSVAQSVGPYYVEPGEVFELTYGAAGRYQGNCPLSEGARYDIVVTE